MKRFIIFVPLMLAASCGNLPFYNTGTVNAFYDGFENGAQTNSWSLEAARTNCIEIVTNDPRSGTHCVKFTVYPGDPLVNDGSRSEIAHDNFDPYLGEVWYGWSFLIPTNYTDSGTWQIIGQWHDQPDYQAGEQWTSFVHNSPPVSFQFTNDTVGLILIYRDESAGIPQRIIAKGVWHDAVFHFKWSMYDDGFAEAWLDGTALTTPGTSGTQRIYAPTCFNTAGNYLKLGLYRSTNAAATNSVYYDEVRIGSSYGEVVPR